MIKPYYIETLQEYKIVKERGHEPLVDNRFFIIDIVLRVQLQNELFGLATIGKRNIPKANEKFYHYCWNNKLHVCQECLLPLQSYSAVYVSHILTKGSKPEMAHDARNINILCFKCHNLWDTGTISQKKQMKIYPKNIRIIETLKNDYQKL